MGQFTQRQHWATDIFTESTDSFFVTVPDTTGGERFHLPLEAEGGYSLILQQIQGESGIVDTAVDYTVDVVFGWADGKHEAEELAVGTYLNATGFLRLNNTDTDVDRFYPDYFKIRITPSASTPSTIRAIVTII